MSARCLAALAATTLSFTACDNTPLQPTVGVDVPLGACGHAMFVVSSDYEASSVGIVGWNGKVLAPIALSAASATTGLSAPLSGDLVSPTMATENGIVLIAQDTGVISYFDPPSGKVRAQLIVGATDPYDYVGVSTHKAYVANDGEGNVANAMSSSSIRASR